MRCLQYGERYYRPTQWHRFHRQRSSKLPTALSPTTTTKSLFRVVAGVAGAAAAVDRRQRSTIEVVAVASLLACDVDCDISRAIFRVSLDRLSD